MGETELRKILLHIRPGVTDAAYLVNRVRLDEPGAALAQAGLAEVISEYPTNRFFPSDHSIFLYARSYFIDHASARSSIRFLCEKNYIVVMDVDDHPDGMTGHAEDDYYSLGSLHAIQTSTQEIADFLLNRNIVPEVGVFANQLADLPPPPGPRLGGRIRLAFASLERGASWQTILPAVNNALAQLGDNVQCAVVQDRALFDGLACRRKYFHKVLPTARYMELLRLSDIHVMPLTDTSFNRAKSDLKFIESAAQGAVCLASPVVYGRTMRHDETGVIFNNPEELTAQLIDLVTNHQRRERIRQAAYAYVAQERLLSQHIHKRHEWYCSLLDRRAELHAALKARRPEFNL